MISGKVQRGEAFGPKEPRRVLVFRTGHLGDTVCAIPAFRLIRKFFAQAELTLLCDRPSGAKVASADVVRNLGLFENIFTYTSNHGLLTLWELACSTRKARPDLVIILPQVRESVENVRRKTRFFRRCGAPDVRGHLTPGERHAWHPNEADRLIGMLNEIGVSGEKPGYDIPVQNASRETVRAKLRTVGVDPDLPFILFCGGGKDATQRWPLERYATVLPRMAEEVGWPFVALGNPKEMEDYRKMVLPHFAGLKLLPECLNTPEIFELCRLASGYFGNDTGPMHVAASVGCPIAALMNARALPGSWHPDVVPNHVIRLRLECEGCFLTDCVEEKHRCMTGITVERVMSEVIPFLKSLPGRQTINA